MNKQIDPLELSGIPIFQGVGMPELEKITQCGRLRRYNAGEYIFLQGDPAERFHILVRGRIKLIQTSQDGQQVLLRVIGTGTMFGGMVFSAEDGYPVTAEAAEECQVVVWGKAGMMAVIKENPKILINMLGLITQQMVELESRFTQLVTERVERRIARSLLRLGSQFGRKTSEGVLIDMPLTRQDLAEMCGTTLYTVSRTLSLWEARGLVKSGREQVIIRFPHGLVTIAEDLPRPGMDDPSRSGEL